MPGGQFLKRNAQTRREFRAVPLSSRVVPGRATAAASIAAMQRRSLFGTSARGRWL